MTFHDHFSGHAAAYAGARPTYPPALFDWLASQCVQRGLAWDAGCGNGQAALALATAFERVIATDPSANQIAAAPAHPRINYRVEPAEASSLAPDSVDLVVVAQALHWIDPDRFHAEVRRVAKPEAVVAAWCYELARITPAIDAVVLALYRELEPFWPPERRHVEAGYATLPFPYAALDPPVFAMRHDWTLPQWQAYLGTWSAVQRCRRGTGEDPLARHAPALAAAWGDPAQPRTVEWPLALRVGRVRV